jgi:DNA-binding NtrC family response regulator
MMTHNFRVLVVDDEDSVRNGVFASFPGRATTWWVLQALRPRGSLIQKEGAWFDLLLVDIRMPGMDGIALMEKVKAQRPDVEIIIMTGYATVETAVKAMKKGAYDYLSKPFEMDELLHLVKKGCRDKIPAAGDQGTQKPVEK